MSKFFQTFPRPRKRSSLSSSSHTDPDPDELELTPAMSVSPRPQRSRVGSAFRRMSSTFGRTSSRAASPNPSSGGPSRSASLSDLKVDTSSPPNGLTLSPPVGPVQHAALVSPVAESPVREAAATEPPAPQGPHPLSNSPVEAESQEPAQPAPAEAPAQAAEATEPDAPSQVRKSESSSDESSLGNPLPAAPAQSEPPVLSDSPRSFALSAPTEEKADPFQTILIPSDEQPPAEPVGPSMPEPEPVQPAEPVAVVAPVYAESLIAEDVPLSSQTTPRAPPIFPHRDTATPPSPQVESGPRTDAVLAVNFRKGALEDDAPAPEPVVAVVRSDALEGNHSDPASNWVDPFVDPVMPTPMIPVQVVSSSDSIHMPEPEQEEVHHLGSPSVAVPMNSLHELFAVRRPPDEPVPETDERLPLLKRTSLPNLASSSTVHGEPDSAASYGWTTHLLPDGSAYFHHPDTCTITDIDLREPARLGAVRAWMEQDNAIRLPAERGWETWLRETHGNRLVRAWVNHHIRVVSLEPPQQGTAPREARDEDKLDMEYRYWSFVEAHPAHGRLSSAAQAEALDFLTWSYTDCLLPSSKQGPPPFSQEECQELMNLLRPSGPSASLHPVVHTRLVARVLLRSVHWRQMCMRPHRALPADASKNGGPRRTEHAMPFRRALVDVLVSVLCLGIPFLFMGRTPHQTMPMRVDLESGMRAPGPMMVIASCACLVAAIILSASVTFISLQGLDDVSRLAGLLAILCSTASMASTVVALFRYKADVERVAYVGGEGLMFIARRSVVMSLPLVFLAWAIAAFVAGITLYAFRGWSLATPGALRHPFEKATQWTVAGALGGLVGVLITSLVLTR